MDLIGKAFPMLSNNCFKSIKLNFILQKLSINRRSKFFLDIMGSPYLNNKKTFLCPTLNILNTIEKHLVTKKERELFTPGLVIQYLITSRKK